MWIYDFLIFYQSGTLIINGISPYQVFDFNSPIFLALFFAPFSLLPARAAYGVYLLANIFLAWKLLGKKIIWAFLFFPFLFSLFVGQIDFLLAALLLIGSPWALGLALIKPQVAIVVVPWLIMQYKKSDFLKGLISVLVFIGISFIVQPSWVSEWLSTKPEFDFYSMHASNFYWLIPMNLIQLRAKLAMILPFIILPLGFLLANRKLSWTVLHLFAPLTNIYSSSVLLEWIGPIECLISWLAVLIVKGNIHTGMPLFFVGISILVREAFQMKKENQSPRSLFVSFMNKP
ncbi:MAG: hypothetical protein BGO78_05730 [Chloroflexi bacterium 44-23]|nr:MAG: hypothetical protein BGO78_05730 [Chloroflexi bacterium 44-23]